MYIAQARVCWICCSQFICALQIQRHAKSNQPRIDLTLAKIGNESVRIAEKDVVSAYKTRETGVSLLLNKVCALSIISATVGATFPTQKSFLAVTETFCYSNRYIQNTYYVALKQLL